MGQAPGQDGEEWYRIATGKATDGQPAGDGQVGPIVPTCVDCLLGRRQPIHQGEGRAIR